MENNENDSSKSLSATSEPQSDGVQDMIMSSTSNAPKREIGASKTNHKRKFYQGESSLGSSSKSSETLKLKSEDEEAASKLKGIDVAVKLKVRSFNGLLKFSVQVSSLDSTVESLKELIVANTDIPVQNQRLFYKGQILQNDRTLGSYGLRANDSVYVGRCFAPTNTNDDGEGDGEGDDLFGEGFSEFEQMQQPLCFTTVVIIRSVLYGYNMQHLMANPEVMSNIYMISSNILEPMNLNPEQLLNNDLDTSTVLQIAGAARYCEFMHEMLRLSDIELGSIEYISEGFNLLRRYMFEHIQESNVTTTMTGSTGISRIYDGQARGHSANSESNAASEGFNLLRYMYENIQESNVTTTMTGSSGISRIYDGQAWGQSTNSESNAASEGFSFLRFMYEDIQESNVTTTMTGSTGISRIYDGQAMGQSTNSATNAASSSPNTTPLPNPWSIGFWSFTRNNAIVDDQSSITADGDAMQREPIVFEDIGFSNLEGMLGSNVMPNATLGTQPIPGFMEFIPSYPEALCQYDLRTAEQRGMPDLSSLRDEIQNPDFLGLSPPLETLQQPLSSQEQLPPQLSQQQETQETGQTTGGTEPPEQLYADELLVLEAMGFSDRQEIIRALIATSGRLYSAFRLLHRRPSE